MTPRRLLCLSLAAAAMSLQGLFAQEQQAPAAPSSDNLNLRFANGIAAVVEGKAITVDDIRREITPHIKQLQSESRNEQEFNQKLEALQDEIIQNLIDRQLIIKEFYKKKDDDDEVRRIPTSYIDNRIAEVQIEQFDNDRSKFLAYLRSRGLTMRDYRREVEEDIVYSYMRGQQRKSQSVISPVKIEQYYNENKDRFYQEDKVKLRMIQFSRAQAETDEQLRKRAEVALNLFKAGERFDILAKQYSQDARRTRGGDWGWQQRNDLKKEFSEPLFNIKAGESTDIIITPEGAFLLFAEDRKYAGIQAIDDVRDQIERILLQMESRQSQQKWLERLRRNAYVKHY